VVRSASKHPRERSERGSLRSGGARPEVVFLWFLRPRGSRRSPKVTEEIQGSKKRYGLTERLAMLVFRGFVHSQVRSRNRRDLNTEEDGRLATLGTATSKGSNPVSIILARKSSLRWTRRDLNPGPLPCEGSDLPLIYEPANSGSRCTVKYAPSSGRESLRVRRPVVSLRGRSRC
jgi:hypothetical protein